MASNDNWNEVKTSVSNGFIAIVSSESPEWEKRAVAEFSAQTKHLLGYEGIYGPTPFLTVGTWNALLGEDPRLHVCAAVVQGQVVGYSICRWRYRITNAEGRVLDAEGSPIPPRPLKTYTHEQLLSANPEELEKWLETWCIEAVFALPEFRRQGLGRALLQTAASSLGVELEDIAFREPISPDGTALLESLGLRLEQLKRYDI